MDMIILSQTAPQNSIPRQTSLRKISLVVYTALAITLLTGCGSSRQSSDTNVENSISEQPDIPSTEQPETPITEPENTPPIAVITNYGLGKVGATYTIDGSSSRDTDGDSLTFDWMIVSKPESSLTVFDIRNDKTVKFEPDFPGDYIIELLVSDGVETGSQQVKFTAATQIKDDIFIDTDLVLERHPYIVARDITIMEGATLTIPPGVKLYTSEHPLYYGSPYKSFSKVTVLGEFLALGNESEQIELNDLRMDIKGKVEISHSTISFKQSNNGSNTSISGIDSISSDNANVIIRNSKFYGGGVLIIEQRSNDANLEGNIFTRGWKISTYDGGWSSYDGKINIRNNLFDSGYSNRYEGQLVINLITNSNTTIEKNSFINNVSYAVTLNDRASVGVDGGVLLANNYWDTVNDEEIKPLIHDEYYQQYGNFDFTPFLLEHHADTPTRN